MEFGFEWEVIPQLLTGAGWTIVLVSISGTVGTLLGFVLGVGETIRFLPVRAVCITYVNIVRGIPLLVIIFFIYFGAPLAIPALAANAFVSALAALAIYTAAYTAEIFRGGVEGVSDGQSEAARAIGLPYLGLMAFVILPQAVRLIVAPLISFSIVLVKESALVSVIGYIELMKAAGNVSAATQEPLLIYSIAAAMYVALCLGLSYLGRAYERRNERITGRRPAAAGRK